jgi:hypothetical protein
MYISDLGRTLGYEPVQPEYQDREVEDGYTSDLLSDVMANAASDSVLITIQAHKNTVAVASLVGISAIVVCNSRPIPDDMTEAAKQEGVAVYRTAENQFTASARVHGLLSLK